MNGMAELLLIVMGQSRERTDCTRGKGSMKKGIIFDLDGTLWDSAKEVVSAWNEVIAGLPDKDHLVTLEEIYSLMGKPMNEIAALVFPNMDLNRREEVMGLCCERENNYLRETGGELFSQLEETLQKLGEKYGLYIVSNCQTGYIEAFLEHYGFGNFFSDTENYGSTGKLKADNIKLVMERNHLEQAVYVGDTAGDYAAATQAQIPFIFAEYGFGAVPEASYRILHFNELPEMAEEVFERGYYESDKKLFEQS